MTTLEKQALVLASLVLSADATLDDGPPSADVWLDADQWRALVDHARALMAAKAEATP